MLLEEYGKFSTYRQVPTQSVGQIFVVPGFAEGFQQTKPIIRALASKNLAAYTYSQPRLGSRQRGLRLHPLERQGRVALIALDELIPGQSKVTVVAHSLGTAAILKAAQLNSRKFSRLILMQPVGLAERQSFSDLFIRSLRKNHNNYHLSKKMLSSANRRSVVKAQLSSIATIAQQPSLAFREVAAISNYDITKDIKKVVDSGIGVDLVISKNDEYFDYNKMQPVLESLKKVVSSITILDKPHHGHDINWLDPDLTSELTLRLFMQSKS